MSDVVFAPNAVGGFFPEFETSATFEFEESHGDAFRTGFQGTGIAAVPLPPAAAGYLTALGLLGRVGRGRSARGLRKRRASVRDR